MSISKTIILIFFLIGCSNVNDNFGNNILIPMKIYPSNCINKDCQNEKADSININSDF